MRKLIWIIVTLAVLYGGYWFVGSRLLDSKLRGWFDDRRAAGEVASYDLLRVQGFPSRFDLHIEGLELGDRASGWGWKAPVVELDALSYQPQHYIAVWPQSHTVTTPRGDVAVNSTDMRASLVFVPGPSFVLDRMTLVASDLALRQAAPLGPGLDLGAKSLRFATMRAPAMDFGHHIGLEVTELALPPTITSRLTTTTLPATMARLHLDTTVDFDARWDRHALRGRKPQITHLRLDDLSMSWGGLELTASGTLEVGADGQPRGAISISARQWRQALDALVALGILPANRRGMIEAGLTFAAASGGGGPDELKADLTFRDGVMSFGALPLGPAPRLVIR